MEFYKGKIEEVYNALDSGEKGLSADEARARLEKYGYNRIEVKKKRSPLLLLLEQFNDPMIWVLLAAALISLALGEAVDFYVILAILIINAVIGFVQEHSAEQAIEALMKMASLKAVVVRDGEEREIDASELVPGDVILLSTGDKMPADARIINLNNLQTQEAALTGESLPVKKETAGYSKDLPLGDRKNLVFSGTVITEGKGKAIVVKTGMATEIGKIAKMIEGAGKEDTPLQKNLDKLGRFLTYGTLGVCAVIFIVLFVRQGNVLGALQTSASLAVAAIPEGLPAIVTISLALGVQRMVRRHALIRKLPSVETLGSTTVICTDKTGTLTKNEMTVKRLLVDGKIIEVSGAGYTPIGTFSEKPESLELLLRIGLLNNDARLEKNEEGAYKIRGDPTEGALIVAGEKAGISHLSLMEKHPRLDEMPFDSTRKRMTTTHEIGGKRYAYVKGAPDLVLALCDRALLGGKAHTITAEDKKAIHKANDLFSSQALRVLGFAYKELKASDPKDSYETNLVFVGLQGMIDPPREEAKHAIAKCKTAGIKVVMITGDFRGTAVAIARELGIEGKAITGEELEKIDLDKEVEGISVYARVNPEHKMQIINALKKNGHVVAMTGDGVNDAPALKSSDIGISMGITGTDVAKEASDMILTDDNFASIVAAVEEGRGIYDNIKKFVQYLLSCNIGEILTIFVATLIGLPLPLIPTQLLWMNLLTDGLPATALGVDPSSGEIMKRQPRKSKNGIITKSFATRIVAMGTLVALCTLAVFWYFLNIKSGASVEYARTIAFTTLVLLQFVPLYIIRREYGLGILSNGKLVASVVMSVALQIIVIYTRLGKLFGTVPIAAVDWLFIIGAMWVLFLLSRIMDLILDALGMPGTD
ncbi:MAG: calcium-translocating P-type ATPase, SERCA-type [Candidatus Thermoplasmatota archaeon]|nr:calcium-translocating P-type ATPase, SERCA-type [Candidatus Thermoplasmatota archaeon]